MEHFISVDVRDYLAAGKPFFVSPVPIATECSAALSSLQLRFDSTKKTAVGVMNGIMNLQVMYERDCVPGTRNSGERFAFTVLDKVVPLPNTVTRSPDVP